jgi:hypothetical protein
MRQACHWWQKIATLSFTAMILFMSFLLILTVWAVAASIVALRSDGFGDTELARRNQPPESFPRGR